MIEPEPTLVSPTRNPPTAPTRTVGSTVTGRADDVVVTGGENVAPSVVESVLRAHPSVSDVRVFEASEGLTWLDSAGRTFTMSLHDLEDWHGVRAQSGKVAPRGFPRSNRFGPAFD